MKNLVFLTLFVIIISSTLVLAVDWYARPFTLQGYNSNDGSSYQNAFNGVFHDGGIDWTLISPGDTLYVCGFHDGGGFDYDFNGPTTAAAPHILALKSGNETHWITIKGDCPNDPGTIFGASMKYTNNWTLIDSGNNIWSRPYSPYSNNNVQLIQSFEWQKSSNDIEEIKRLNNATDINFGSWQQGTWIMNNLTLYYKPTSATANDYTFYIGYGDGNILIPGNTTYIIIKNIRLWASTSTSSDGNLGIRDGADHVYVDGISTRWSHIASISPFGSTLKTDYNLTIINSIIRNSKSGIYIGTHGMTYLLQIMKSMTLTKKGTMVILILTESHSKEEVITF